MPTPPRTCKAPVAVDIAVVIDVIIVCVLPIVNTPNAPVIVEPMFIVVVELVAPAVPILTILVEPAAVTPIASSTV